MEICLATEPTWAACAVILDGDEIVPRNFSPLGARCFHRQQRITDRHRCMCLDGMSALEAAVTGTTRPVPDRHSNVCSSNNLRRHALSECGHLDFTDQLSFFTTLLLIGSQRASQRHVQHRSPSANVDGSERGKRNRLSNQASIALFPRKLH
jgi:hypothetical protein